MNQTSTPIISDIGQYLTVFKIFQIKPVVNQIVIVILVFATILALILLLVGGIQWIVSGGDKEKIASAREKIMAALIGLLIVFLAWGIVGILRGFFGI